MSQKKIITSKTLTTMVNYVKTTLLIVFGIFLISCSSTEIAEAIIVVEPDAEAITYNKDVQSIINNSCATTACHGSATPPAGLSLNTFAQVESAVENRGLVARMNNSADPMPQAGMLSQSLRSVIDQWVADGLLED